MNKQDRKDFFDLDFSIYTNFRKMDDKKFGDDLWVMALDLVLHVCNF